MHSSSLIQTENGDNLTTTRHLKTKQKYKQDSAITSTLSKKPHKYGPFLYTNRTILKENIYPEHTSFVCQIIRKLIIQK